VLAAGGGALTLGVAEHLVVLQRRHLGHELLHGRLRRLVAGLRLPLRRRLGGGGAALPAVGGGLGGRGLPGRLGEACPGGGGGGGGAQRSQEPVGLGRQNRTLVGVLLLQRGGLRHGGFRASLRRRRRRRRRSTEKTGEEEEGDTNKCESETN